MRAAKLDDSPFPGWPSQDCKAVLELVGDIRSVARKRRLTVNRDSDELGPYDGVHFTDVELGPVALVSYDQGPSGHYFVFVDRQANQVQAIIRLKQVLGIKDSDVIWPAGDAAKELKEAI